MNTSPETFHFDKERIITQRVQDVMENSNFFGDCNRENQKRRLLVHKETSAKTEIAQFPAAYILSTYGNWWNECPSKTDEFMPQNNSGTIISDDFLEFIFSRAVYPISLNLFGINTSAVVKVWALQPKTTWVLIWEGQNARNDSGLRSSLKIPLKCTKHVASVFRIDFNQRNQDYYTEISDVTLEGCTTPPINISNEDAATLNNAKQSTSTVNDSSMKLTTEALGDLKMDECYILQLPDEITLKICNYLDIKSLTRLGFTCRYMEDITETNCLYRELSFKSSWYWLTGETLKTFIPRCETLTKLDMSWCGLTKLRQSDFSIFLKGCCTHLTHLRLNYSEFVIEKIIVQISQTCPNLKELELRGCKHLSDQGFKSLKQLTKLERLDLCETSIRTPELLQILEANPNLKHLNLSNTSSITTINNILEKLAQTNKQLVSLNLCACSEIIDSHLNHISYLHNLQELDLSWCKHHTVSTGEDLSKIAKTCSKLRKLFLGAWFGITDENLLPFTKHCRDLEQVSLLGLLCVSAGTVLEFLTHCKNLKLLDVNSCPNITPYQVGQWRKIFPEVSIKHSLEGRALCYLK